MLLIVVSSVTCMTLVVVYDAAYNEMIWTNAIFRQELSFGTVQDSSIDKVGWEGMLLIIQTLIAIRQL